MEKRRIIFRVFIAFIGIMLVGVIFWSIWTYSLQRIDIMYWMLCPNT